MSGASWWEWGELVRICSVGASGARWCDLVELVRVRQVGVNFEEWRGLCKWSDLLGLGRDDGSRVNWCK